MSVYNRYAHVMDDEGRGFFATTVAYPEWPTAYGTSYVGRGFALEVLPPEVTASDAVKAARADRALTAIVEADRRREADDASA